MAREVGVWEPRRAVRVEADALRRYAGLMGTGAEVDLSNALDEEVIRRDAALMKQSEDAWAAAEELDNAELEALVRFFTLAEMQLPGWEGGKQSPVIYLVRLLKARGGFTSELRKWIKTHTDNRYLPYGSLL